MRTLHEPWQRETVRRYFAEMSRERRQARAQAATRCVTLRFGSPAAEVGLQQLTHRCYLCRRPFGECGDPTFDHVVPRARNGPNHANRLAACQPCNVAKGSRMPTAAELAVLARVNELLALKKPRTNSPPHEGSQAPVERYLAWVNAPKESATDWHAREVVRRAENLAVQRDGADGRCQAAETA